MLNYEDEQSIKIINNYLISYSINIEKRLELIRHIEKTIKENYQFDIEYNYNMKKTDSFCLFKKEYIINKSWKGVWLRCTGMDAFIFRTWVIIGLRDKLFGVNELTDYFMKTHPNEKFITNPIIQSQQIMNKIKLMENDNLEIVN